MLSFTLQDCLHCDQKDSEKNNIIIDCCSDIFCFSCYNNSQIIQCVCKKFSLDSFIVSRNEEKSK